MTEPDIQDVTVENIETANVAPGGPPPVNDTITVRIVVLLLGAIVLGIIIAETILQTQDRTLPDVLLTLGGVAVGALGAMLASTASRKA